METFFCYAGNCLRAHIHVLLRWAKVQVEALAYHVSSSYRTFEQIVVQQVINRYGYTGCPQITCYNWQLSQEIWHFQHLQVQKIFPRKQRRARNSSLKLLSEFRRNLMLVCNKSQGQISLWSAIYRSTTQCILYYAKQNLLWSPQNNSHSKGGRSLRSW
jgi:hypothetical protein